MTDTEQPGSGLDQGECSGMVEEPDHLKPGRHQRAQTLEQLDCGCYRYCDSCTDSRPTDSDLIHFSRNLTQFLGEAWCDWGHWEATELNSLNFYDDRVGLE